MTFSAKTLEAIAFHEAGHAVQALVEGGRILRATVCPDGKAAGHILHVKWRLRRDGNLMPNAAAKTGRTCLAGPAATRRHNPRLIQLDQMYGDRSTAFDYANRISKSDRECDALLHLWTVQVEDSMEKHWHLVQAVAHALLDRKRMTGIEVQAVYDEARVKRMETLLQSH